MLLSSDSLLSGHNDCGKEIRKRRMYGQGSGCHGRVQECTDKALGAMAEFKNVWTRLWVPWQGSRMYGQGSGCHCDAERKLNVFGHVCRMKNSRLTKSVVFGMVDETRTRGRLSREWLDDSME